MILYRHTEADFPITRAKAIAVLPLTRLAVTTYTDSPLRPATYHYALRCFTPDGALGPSYWYRTCTVT
jgi:hypothetical protein